MIDESGSGFNELLPMRALLDGASLEGLYGINAVLETEIKLLLAELEEVVKRIEEKIAAGEKLSSPEEALLK